YFSVMRAHSSPSKYSPSRTDSIWSHYRGAVSRIAKELHKEPSLTSVDDSENSPQYLAVPVSKNKMSVTYRRSEHSSLKQINTNLPMDHNNNRIHPRSRHGDQLTRQLSIDLEEARSENAVLRKLLDERREIITKMRGEMTSMQRQIRMLSAGRNSERSKWNAAREEGNERMERTHSVQSVSLSELSPVMSRRDERLRRHQSTITYSSQTPETSSLSTPKRTANSGWLPPLPLPRVSTPPSPLPLHSTQRDQRPFQPSSSSTPKRNQTRVSCNNYHSMQESTPPAVHFMNVSL
ncbi:hypothetical protein PFISCL1PPCAC_28971, partial [Pristionchus fissidentatus]